MTESPANYAIADTTITQEQLRLLAVQASRTLMPLMMADLFLLWVVYTIGEVKLGLVWFATVTALHLVRRHYARALVRELPSPGCVERTWHRMNALFFLVGVARAALIPLCFQYHGASAKFFVTMMMIGMAAGGIASVAGNIKPFLMWAGPIFLSLIAAWTIEGGVEGYSFAFLVALMFPFILAAIRDQQRVLIESMRIREQNRGLMASVELERDRARSASEAKTRFFAAASHDLRQPLHALSLHAATLDLIATDDRTKRVSEQLNRSLTHANSLLEGLIDLSRLDANAVTPRIKSFSVESMFRSLENEFQIDCEQRQLFLRFEQTLEDLWISSDPDLVLRIFRNLVGNALKFTDQGGITVTAHALDRLRIAVTVRDTGIGIPEAEHQHVFEEFYQIGNPGRDRSRGLGLGLSIVQRLADMLDARLTMSSRPMDGSSFEMVFARTAPTQTESASAEKRDFSTAALRVLIVDDEEPIISALIDFLTEVGWVPAGATSRTQAFALLRDGFTPDVLVADVRLGSENGIDLVRALRAEFGPIAVLLVTGESDPAKMDEIKLSGFPFVNKPVDGPRLAEQISQAIEAVRR